MTYLVQVSFDGRCGNLRLTRQMFINIKIVAYCVVQGVKKVPDPKQNYIGLMTEG